MSRRSRLMIALLAVVSMGGGATSGVYLGRLEDTRRVAATRPPPAPPVPWYWIQSTATGGSGSGPPPPGGQAATPAGAGGQDTVQPRGQAAPPSSGLAFVTETTVPSATPTTILDVTTTTASSPGAVSTTGPLVLTARIDARLPDGLLIRLDASQPLHRAVLRWGAGKTLAHTAPIQGTVAHGSVKLPLDGKALVTVQASGTTADGRTVTSNRVSGQPS
jgi:hypothetical protein